MSLTVFTIWVCPSLAAPPPSLKGWPARETGVPNNGFKTICTGIFSGLHLPYLPLCG